MAGKDFECGYCGAIGPASDDHIPPKSFFEGVTKEQLRTVKACVACNGGASKDDEYFRDTVVKYYRVADQSKAKPIVDKMIRAAALPAKKAYVEAQLRSFTGVFGVSPTAPELGSVPAFAVDGARMERAARRYIRGLHRYDFGESITAEEVPIVVTDPEQVFAQQAKIAEMMKGGEHHVVQDGVLEYMWATGEGGSRVCLMIFFREYAMIGFVGHPPA